MNTLATTPISSIMTEAKMLEQQKAVSVLKQMGKNGNSDKKKLWEAAKGFESMFMNQMYKAMRKTLPENEFNKASKGREIFTEMLDAEYSKMSSGKTENGLAGMVYRQLMESNAMIESEQSSSDPVKMVKIHNANLAYRQKSSNKMEALTEEQLAPLIKRAAEKFDLDIDLIRSVIHQESAGKPYALAKAGAKGLMQLMDSTAAELGVKNVFDPGENIMGGAKYLKKLKDMYKGDERLTLAAYNAGPGNVKKYGGVPPFAETERYIEKVLQQKEQIKI